jgi:hypothetical protein
MLVIYLTVFGCGTVFGLSFWLLDYCSKRFPSFALFEAAAVGRAILVVLAASVLLWAAIGILRASDVWTLT